MASPSITMQEPRHIDFIPPAAKIPLTIPRRKQSTLDGGYLYEKVPIERIRALIHSDHLKDKWDQNKYNFAHIEKYYKNERRYDYT